jgi:hypothetical protein
LCKRNILPLAKTSVYIIFLDEPSCSGSANSNIANQKASWR